MKTKISFSVLLLFCVLLFSFSKKDFNTGNESIIHPSTNSGPDSQFLIAVMEAGLDTAYVHYPDLGVNGWHKYTGPVLGWPNIPNDNYNVPTSQYAGAVLGRIDSNRQNGLRSIMDRPKIEYTAFGQQSFYQCENVNVGEEFWWYAYNTSVTGTYITDIQDSSATVKYCQTIPSSPGSNAGYIVKDLRSNREQANRFWPPWIADSLYQWYVMPRIRIPTGISDNTPVCRIEVFDWDSNLVKNVDILAGNFRNSNNPYNGQYLEEFYFSPEPEDPPSAIEIPPGILCPGERRHFADWEVPIKTDFRVYWYGQCNMWIDYVRVENLPARELFSGDFDDDIREETQLALSNYDPNNPIPNNFYIEEFEFNIVNAMSYVNNIIMDESGGKLSLMVNLSYPMFKYHIPGWNTLGIELSAEKINNYLIEKAGLKYLVNMSYPLEGFETGGKISYHPVTLSTSGYNKNQGILSYPASVNDYEDSLQWKLDYGEGAGDRFTKIMQKTDSISKYYSPDLKLIHLAQAHLWWTPAHKLKEPSNEELSMMVNLSIAYGAKGIMYFSYPSFHEFNHPDIYGRGLTNPILSSPYFEPRVLNAYEQPKWERVKSINQKLKQWEPYLMSFDNENRKSFIYRIPNERSAMTTTTFINELKAFPPVEFAPEDPQETDEWLENSTPDIANSTYVQAAFFNRQDDGEVNKYFMIVNRRCSPYISISSAANVGGRRLVTMKVNPSQLPGFNNWKVINLEDSSVVAAFNKNSTSQIYIGDFMPGQGKLFKVAPVMQEGGILVTDEEVNSTFTCKGMIYSTDRDIYLGPLTKISFATSAGINMTGGIFQCGEDVPFSSSPELKGQPGSFWSGIELNECSQVMIHKTVFKNLAPMKYAVSMVDCFDFNVSTNTFLINDAIKVGAVRTDYLFQSSPEEILAFFNYNNITINSSIFQTFQCNSYGSANIPLMMNGNTFTAAAGSTAIGLFNIGEAVIKNNIINNYTTGISIFGPASYADLYENTFSSTLADSKGITVTDGSVNLGPAGIYYMGGLNHVTVSGNSGNNIELDGGYFNINKGENTFNITDITLFGFHFTGTFQYETSYEAAGENCFMFDGNPSSPSHTVINPVSSDPVNFDFDALTCSPEELEDFDIFSLGGGEYDTVYMESGGSGGGFSSTVIPVDLSTRLCISSGGQAEALAQVELYSEINIEMRKRNYEEANEKCYEFLDLYINDERSLNVLSRLYLSSLMLDSAGSMMTTVKTFYENLILSHGESENLVRKAFYLLQKCKASLGLYSDAMSGFQEIINQNPYNYIGLAAKWDYMAVHLLDSLSGTGGGIDNDQLSIDNDQLMPGHPSGIIINDQLSLFDDKPREVNLRNDYDKKFTQVQKEQISGSIKRSLTGSREEQVEAVRELVKKVEQGDKRSAVELDKRNRLNESVIIRKPRDIAEHRNIIREDIEKVFAAAEGMQEMKDSPNLIPQSFELYQNFPNPFNPATKIRFDLPQSAKVTLRVYDILGRELVRIVNNMVLDAGAHVYDFSSASGGTSLASGVYFYRLETTEPGSSNILFLKTKKMVLLR